MIPWQVFDLVKKCQPKSVPSIGVFLAGCQRTAKSGIAHTARKSLPQKQGAKWPARTLQFIQKHKLPPPIIREQFIALQRLAPFQSLTNREQKLLPAAYAYMMKRNVDPWRVPCVFSIDQSIHRLPFGIHRSPCLTVHSRLWSSWSGRLLEAGEVAALQGFASLACLQEIPPLLLRDLMGDLARFAKTCQDV